jgi:large conductance mechanosensitive channel
MAVLSGFKKFLLRGNVVDLAVAVVVGAAFTAIVTSITAKVIQPLIAALGGERSVEGFGFRILKDNPATFVDLGAVISTTINFVLVASVIYFFVVLPINHFNERLKAKKGLEEPDEPASERDLLEEIRNLLAAQATCGADASAPPKLP